MLLIDPESGEIIYANPSAEKFYGWSHEELQSKYIQEINQLTADEVRREMENAREEKYRLLFNYSNDAIFVHEIGEDNLPGKNNEVNEQAASLLGYSREELLNMSAKDVTPDIEKAFSDATEQGKT